MHFHWAWSSHGSWVLLLCSMDIPKGKQSSRGRMDVRGQESLPSKASSWAKISFCPSVCRLFASVSPVLLHVLCYIPPSSPTHLRCSFRHFKEKMAERNTLSPQCDTATAPLEPTVMAQGAATSPQSWTEAGDSEVISASLWVFLLPCALCEQGH